jgi:hypothetical protein
MFLAVSASLLACGSNNNNTADAPKTDAAHDAGSGSGSGSGSAVGSAFEITGFANGLYWDSTANALYFTEKVSGSGNAFCKWTDAGGIEVVASLDGIGSANPGEIVKLADGSFVFPQFSKSDINNGVIQVVGSAATLFKEEGSGALGSGGGSDVGLFRSFALTLGADGSTMYQATFVGTGTAGFVVQTTLDTVDGSASQTVVAQGGGSTMIGKTSGLVVNADGSMILGDQTHNTFWLISPQGAFSTFVASYIHPDLLMALPNGDMLDGGGSSEAGRADAINHIALNGGAVTPLTFQGVTFTYVAGMAYDATNHRLFVDDQAGSANDTIRILPYTP